MKKVKNSEVLCCYFSKEFKEEIAKKAEESGLTMNTLIRLAITEYLKKNK